MPYSKLSELPPQVKALPTDAQRIFRAAFNSASKQYDTEEQAFRVAWAAVKNKYKKVKGQWVAKEQSDESPKSFALELQSVYDLFREHCPKADETPLADVEKLLQEVSEETQWPELLQKIEETFVPVFLPLEQYHDEYPGSYSSRTQHVQRAYAEHQRAAKERKSGEYDRYGYRHIVAVYPDHILVCRYDYSAYNFDEREYVEVPYTFNEDTNEATFGEERVVNVLTITVPVGGNAAGYQDGAASQAAGEEHMEETEPKEKPAAQSKEKAEEKPAEQKADAEQDGAEEDEEEIDQEAVSKTEDGHKFSKSAYLIVGDAEKPTTWKVRVEETPGKITLQQLGRAYAALTKGFRGNKVQATEEQVQSALGKLKKLYRKLDAPWPGSAKNQEDFGDDIPDWLLLGLEPPGGPEELVQTNSVLLQVTGKDKKTGVMHVQGTATVGNVVNSKQQVYPTEVWQDNLPRLQQLAQSGKLMGECDHPVDGRSTLERTCILYKELWMDGDEVKFKADILPTEPYGKNLQILIENGAAVDISSRGRGATQKGEWNGVKGVNVVQRGFQCATFDSVVNGASPGSTITDFEIAQSHNAAEEDDQEMGEVSEKILQQLETLAARQDTTDKALGDIATLVKTLAPAAGNGSAAGDEGGEGAQDQSANGNGANGNGNGNGNGHAIIPTGQEALWTETLSQMNQVLVDRRVEELYADACKTLPIQWANVYRKNLQQKAGDGSVKTVRDLDGIASGVLTMVQELVAQAPVYPGMGHIVQQDVGKRGCQTPRELIEEIIKELPDESPFDPIHSLGLDGLQQAGIQDSIRTPRRQLRRWLTNIACARDEAWNGPAAIQGLMRLTQGYQPQQVQDFLDQACPEGTTSVASGGAPASSVFIFPLIRRMFPMLIANELASIQPMDRPEGKIFFLDSYRIEPGASETDAAGVVSSSRVRIDRTDSLSSSYADDPGECEVSARIQLHLASAPVTAQTKKLHALWTIEELQDLRAYHGLDAAAELVASLARELALEWNQIVLNELLAGAAFNTSFGTVAPGGYTQTEWDRYIARFIFQASNNIFKAQRGEMTHIIAGADAWLRLAGIFNLAERNVTLGEAFSGLSMTPFSDGPMAGIRTFKTSFWDRINTNKILILHRGNEWSDTPYVWAPYIDYVSPVLTLPDVFTQKQGMMSRAAHRTVVREAISVVTINAGSTGVPI